MKNNKILVSFIILVLVFLLSACGFELPSISLDDLGGATATATNTATLVPTYTPTLTLTPMPTATSMPPPTNTLAPTSTPASTMAPSPTIIISENNLPDTGWLEDVDFWRWLEDELKWCWNEIKKVF